MMTLNDGRSELWQWDTGRKLTVGADCTQVHFSNKFFGRSIDVDVFDGTAEIPDVLLQVDKDLFVWAFVGTAENGYTKISKIFKVNKRNKPADYVFTPPEQTTLSEILKRLDDIESAQDPDAIKNAVDDYLANNPINVNETDPTVPAWAKQPEKPEYTAQEVGAVATVNGIHPDENGNVEIAVDNVDLSGYATEQYVEEYAQPKGEYLTAVPDGYAKTEDIPTKPEDIGAQPVGDYLTEVPSGYATEEFVKNKIAEAELGGEEVDLSGYAQKSELPTKVSQLQNDVGYLTEHQDISGKLDASALPTAINTALAQAKASGEFDGKDGYTPQKGIDYFDGQPGKDGVDGKDGYTPVKGVDYFDGKDGQDGSPGKNGSDGVSATHSWNGTVLTVTSASGTSSANLKGEKGDKGDQGEQGVQGIQGPKGDTGAAGSNGTDGKDGANGTSVTVKSVSESTADGGSNVVTFSDGKTITIKNGSRGSTGSKGDKGDKGDTGAAGKNGADGYTPVKGTDYFTEADKANIVADVTASLSQIEAPKIVSSVAEMTDTTKHYVLDGYIWHHKTVVTKGETTYPNVFNKSTATINGRLSVTNGAAASATTGSKGCFITDFIELKDWAKVSSYMVRVNFELQSTDIDGNQVFFFDESKTLTGGYVNMFKAGSVITVGDGKTSFDLKQWGTANSGDSPKYVKLRLYKKTSGTSLTTADLDDVEITFDAVNVPGEDIVSQEWVNSGISYAPTFKTDLVGVLGEGNVIYLSDNLPAGTYTLKTSDGYATVGAITKT